MQQRLGIADVSGLTAREEEAQRHAIRIAKHVNLISEATATAA